jgi:hypothetical protein
MSDDRFDGAMTDHGLDPSIERDLQRALAIEPSPEFVARVRLRVADERMRAPWWSGWRMPAIAAAAIVLAVAVIWRPEPSQDFRLKAEATRQQAEAARQQDFRLKAEATRQQAEAARQQDFRLKAEATRQQDFRLKAEATRRLVATLMSGAPESAPAPSIVEPEVLVPSGQREALRRFLTSMRQGRIDGATLLASGVDAGPPVELSIPPLAIEPLPLPDGSTPAGKSGGGPARDPSPRDGFAATR